MTSLKIALQIHYKAAKARQLNSEGEASTFDYYSQFLRDDLSALGIPSPDKMYAIYKGGMIRCFWSLEQNDVRLVITGTLKLDCNELRY